MLRRTTLAFTLILSLAGADAVLACSCAPSPPPQEALQQASAVFTGTVVAVDTSGVTSTVRLQVDRSWKGAKCGEVTVTTPADSAACGFDFQVGQNYLVYADKQQGKFSVSLCSRTSLTSQAGEDLTALGPPEKTCPAQ
jgi:hypothetical protein